MIWRDEFHQRCSRFAATILHRLVQLPKRPIEKYLSDQLMRSATSIGANLSEAQSAESRADFIHKMKIALKEARESSYWLGILRSSGLVNDPKIEGLQKECQEIAAILAQSIITAIANEAKDTANGTSNIK